MTSVFLSYAGEDGAVATRVHDDLLRARSGLRVWCYEKTSQYGVDFRKEYADRIVDADYLVLFDSAFARKSRYVKDEITLWQGCDDCTLVPCLIQEEGAWRSAELFPRQNFVTYVAFTDYESGIGNLCGYLEIPYVPQFTLPRDLDFMAEIKRGYGRLGRSVHQSLIDQYKLFRQCYPARPEAAMARLTVLIDEHLRPAERRVLSPFLALGVLQTAAGRGADALATFAEVTRRAQEDPRGWAGRAACLFELLRYEESAECLERCLECIAAADGSAHDRHLGDVVYNLASVYLAAGRPEDARSALRRMPEGHRSRAETLGLAGRIILRLGDRESAGSYLRQAAHALRQGQLLEPGVLLDLIEGCRQVDDPATEKELIEFALTEHPFDPNLLRSAGVFHSRAERYDDAIDCYERSLRYKPGDARCLVELALLLRHMGRLDGMADCIDRCLEANRQPDDAEYFIGLAHHLAGQTEIARFHYARAMRGSVTHGWPPYEELY